MAYDPAPSASERLILEVLWASGLTSVTVGRLRRWYRRGLPRSLDRVVYFARLIERLGPRHTRHALLVVAGAWPESANEDEVSEAFEAWFEREFGDVADDPKNRWERLYYRMSRAGGVRRRARELSRPPRSVIEHDLREAGYSEEHLHRFVSFDEDDRERFHGRDYVMSWAVRLPAARAALRKAEASERLNALHVGHMWASANGRPEDTPLHALDVLLGQSGGRPMTASEASSLFAQADSRPKRRRARV